MKYFRIFVLKTVKIPKIIICVFFSEWENINRLLHKMVDLIIEQWMQPEKNGFLSRPK